MERIQSINPTRVRWCCDDRGITPAKLAEEAGISEASLDKMLAGEEGLTFPELQRIAKFFQRGVLFFVDPGPIDAAQLNLPHWGTKAQTRSVPRLPCLDEYSVPLAQMVAETSYLSDPGTVAAFGGAVFPTVRSSQKRVTAIEAGGIVVGIYDDNTTPRWALLWSHGISGVSKQPSAGWTFAHVWPSRADLGAYTHLANLAMVPECFGGLTDKTGPLTHFLRWHAWSVYHWKPSGEPEPQRPDGYEEVTWNYFAPIASPREFVHAQLERAGCKRSALLKPLMFEETL